MVLYLVLFSSFSEGISAQIKNPFRVIGYYSGTGILPDSFEVEKLTHIIYCFGGLKGNQFHLRSLADTLCIQRMVQLKKRNPALKVMLSLGGWGGCEQCSAVFSTPEGRHQFAVSVTEVSNFLHSDGIDLDWEYPAIKGFPGHLFQASDREHFTALLREIRSLNPEPFIISFAAGGFTSYIDSSINWKEAMPYVDFVNIMSYDLVHGYSRISGHHTPLYSTPQQTESTDHAVQMLLHKGVDASKLIVGAAIYGRFFQIEKNAVTDLYQPCHFSHGFSFKNKRDSLRLFEMHWDSIAQAPYAIHPKRKLLATFDDERSIALKTQYALDLKLGGIMFWQLYDDHHHDGLLNVIHQTLPKR